MIMVQPNRKRSVVVIGDARLSPIRPRSRAGAAADRVGYTSISADGDVANMSRRGSTFPSGSLFTPNTLHTPWPWNYTISWFPASVSEPAIQQIRNPVIHIKGCMGHAQQFAWPRHSVVHRTGFSNSTSTSHSRLPAGRVTSALRSFLHAAILVECAAVRRLKWTDYAGGTSGSEAMDNAERHAGVDGHSGPSRLRRIFGSTRRFHADR